MGSQENTGTADRAGKGGSGRKAVIIIAVVAVIAVLVGVIVYLIMSRGGAEDAPAPDGETDLRNVVITQDNLEDVLARMGEQEFTDTGYYTVTMTNEWHFADGASASEDAYVENAVENTNDVYFDIYLEEDESEVVMRSPVLPLGSTLNSITLDEDLEPGTYPCIMEYHLIDGEQNTLSTLKVGMTIIVEG